MLEQNRSIARQVEGLDDEQRELLTSALNMHGHACGGMPMGYVAGLAALEALGITRERNMETMAVVYAGHGHAAGCFVDGVQFATGCTFGKGIMRREPRGKWMFMLIHKPSGRAVRVRIRNEVLDRAFDAPFITDYRRKGVKPTEIPEDVARPGFLRPFSLSTEELVEIEGPFAVDVPRPRPCFRRVTCSVCGATVAENYTRLEDGEPVCTDCTHYTS